MPFWDFLFGSKEKASVPVSAPRVGMDLPELARRLHSTPEFLQALQPVYRQVSIPKRCGGTRMLTIPADPLKQMQRGILRLLLAKLPVHPAAHGFVTGRSIVTNARAHVGRPLLVKLDIQNFFPQTAAQRVREYFLNLGWDQLSVEILTRLTTYEGGLPQGAPTSPRLSNLVNYVLDVRLAALAEGLSAVYTRYADDLTFSLPSQDRDDLATLLRTVKIIINDYGYRLHQKKKLTIARAGDRQLVTGLVVNSAVNLPRTTRRRLRAVEHHLQNDRPATLSLTQLAGWNALRTMIINQRDSHA